MNDLEKILSSFNSQIPQVKNKEELEEIRIQFLGKKGAITEIFSQLKNLPAEEKKSFGAAVNELRNQITKKIEEAKNHFDNAELNEKLAGEKIDLSEPIRKQNQGLIHPVNKAAIEIERIFSTLGFEFAEGPEIEDDFHNFTALNMPKDHPARQMQDTFYLRTSSKSRCNEMDTRIYENRSGAYLNIREQRKRSESDTDNHCSRDFEEVRNCEFLLRTHTSNTQIRKMINSKPPMKVASLGRVFRRDSDQTHTPMFHQFEGFVVDEKANMQNLKWVLENFLEKFFEVKNLELRFRPSFFPFTEPSAEVDINYSLENGKIKIGKGDKFMEILGCGMINENVLKNCGIDSEKFQGFAFGIGIERLAMLKYGITDLRMFFENDVRFLQHFGFKASEI